MIPLYIESIAKVAEPESHPTMQRISEDCIRGKARATCQGLRITNRYDAYATAVAEVECFKMVILLCPLDEAIAFQCAVRGENRAIPTH